MFPLELSYPLADVRDMLLPLCSEFGGCRQRYTLHPCCLDGIGLPPTPTPRSVAPNTNMPVCSAASYPRYLMTLRYFQWRPLGEACPAVVRAGCYPGSALRESVGRQHARYRQRCGAARQVWTGAGGSQCHAEQETDEAGEGRKRKRMMTVRAYAIQALVGQLPPTSGEERQHEDGLLG